MKNFSVSFISGIILGVLLAGGWALRNEIPLSLSSGTLTLATSTAPLSTGDGAVLVRNQSAGSTVSVESVTVPPPGVWVAVRETSDDKLGNVLGAARFSGPRTGVQVPLLRATAANRRYAIELYRDDNGGKFDPSLNSVYVDFETSERVVSYFSAI